MAFVTVFRRYELKYMLTLEQKERILQAMSTYMQLDKYGRTTIRNIYFDTDNYRLIRRSIEKPVYEAFRFGWWRCYPVSGSTRPHFQNTERRTAR